MIQMGFIIYALDIYNNIIYLLLFIICAVPPMIVESSTSNDMVVREGSNVTLVCRASGYPEPYVCTSFLSFYKFSAFFLLSAVTNVDF